MRFSINATLGMPLLLAALAGCAQTPAPAALSAGGRYVAMGSSFAAGPGIPEPADTPPTRCARSTNNYAHQLARKRGLALVDVTCSGATTAHLLGPWDELAPQLDALIPGTALVTVTIGGNDVNYVGRLMNASAGQRIEAPDAAAWARLAQSFDRITAEVHRRAPQARLIFVDYVSLLPEEGSCPQAPVLAEDAAVLRATARLLEEATAAAARRAGAGLIRASALSRGHDVCAAQPWASGYPAPGPGGVAYHPNLAGMTAIAEALDASLSR
jgi:lysophospholipase L1-like esterase